jgi:hypothetical protein
MLAEDDNEDSRGERSEVSRAMEESPIAATASLRGFPGSGDHPSRNLIKDSYLDHSVSSYS